jgi:hypothetical protein
VYCAAVSEGLKTVAFKAGFSWLPSSEQPARHNSSSKAHRIKVALGTQVVWLFVMALAVACIAWTITHEEVLSEARDYCLEQSHHGRSLLRRKFFYLFTCEYCFSHYVAAFFVGITRYKLLYQDWRGYIIGGFALVWVANQYMSLYGRLRLDLKKERVEIGKEQKEAEIRRVQAETVKQKQSKPAA